MVGESRPRGQEWDSARFISNILSLKLVSDPMSPKESASTSPLARSPGGDTSSPVCHTCVKPLHLSHNDTVKPLLEPSNSVLRSDLVLSSNLGSHPLPPGDPHSWSTHDDVEIHTENTDSWVVLDTEINVLLDTETEVTGCGEVPARSAPDIVLGEW